MDEKEFQRLTNDKNGMFKKWADVSNQSAIARFMRDALDPRKEYTKKEMTDLWKEYSHDHISFLMKRIMSKSKGYGEIIIMSEKKYCLNPNLLNAFNQYF